MKNDPESPPMMDYGGLPSDFEKSTFFTRKNSSPDNLSILHMQNHLPKMNGDYLRTLNLWEAAAMIGSREPPTVMQFPNSNHNHQEERNTIVKGLGLGRPNDSVSEPFNVNVSVKGSPRSSTLFRRISIDDSLPAEFCKNTSLHGLKYIGQSKVHLCEKIFWSVAFTLAIVIAAYMISAVWQKYKRSPVIVSFQPFETRNADIPFPGITICNMNKVLKSKAESFMRNARGPSKLAKVEEARENVYFMDHVCSTTLSFSKKFNYSVTRGHVPESLMNQILNGANKIDADSLDVKRFLQISSQKCGDMLPLCIWAEQVANCTELFSYEGTDFGKCCTFNMMPKELLYRNSGAVSNTSGEINDWKAWQWDGDNLLTQREEETGDFPRRQKLPGKSFGLSILLNPDLPEYFCTTSDSIGFRLLAHSPIEVPRVVDFGNAIPPNSEVFINVRPTITIADDKIEGFTLEQRQCYFSDEFKLMFYSYYTSTNCLMECVANLTFQKCNCATYYMPRDATRDLCSRKQSRCATSIQQEMIRLGQKTLCRQCLPSCTEIKYRTEITSTPLQNADILWMTGSSNKPQWARSNVSIVHIYFGDESTTSRLRTELYGVIDLFANFGGLMGLCMGFSGLSLIEIVYFMTLRAFCKRRRIHPEQIPVPLPMFQNKP